MTTHIANVSAHTHTHTKIASCRMSYYVPGELYNLLSCYHKPNGEGNYGLMDNIPEVEWPCGVVVSEIASQTRDARFNSLPG